MRLRWVCCRSHGQRGPQGADQLGEAASSAATGSARTGIHRAGQVVGLDRPVEVGPGHGRDRLVGQAEALQDGDRGAVVDGQLDLGQHQRRVALGHQQRAGLAGRLDGEAVPVDQADARRHRVDARDGPRPGRGTTAPGPPPPRPGGRPAAARRSARPPGASPARRRAPRRRRPAAATRCSTMPAYTSSIVAARS